MKSIRSAALALAVVVGLSLPLPASADLTPPDTSGWGQVVSALAAEADPFPSEYRTADFTPVHGPGWGQGQGWGGHMMGPGWGGHMMGPGWGGGWGGHMMGPGWSYGSRGAYGGSSFDSPPLISLALQFRSDLKLTDDQVKKLEDTRDAFAKRYRDDRDKIRTMERDLRQALEAEKPNVADAEKRIRAIEKMKADLRIARVQAIEKGMAVLKNDQRKNLHTYIQRGPASGWGGGWGPGMMGPGGGPGWGQGRGPGMMGPGWGPGMGPGMMGPGWGTRPQGYDRPAAPGQGPREF